MHAVRQIQSGEMSRKEAIDQYQVDVMEGGGQEAVTSRTQAFFTHDFKNYLKSPVATIGNGPGGKLQNNKYNAVISGQDGAQT